MNAGTTPDACVPTSVKTIWGPTRVAAPPASSSPPMAGTVTVRRRTKRGGELRLFVRYPVSMETKCDTTQANVAAY